MPEAPATDPAFQFKGHPEIESPAAAEAAAAGAAPIDPLGPLARLVGDGAEATWVGEGFNAIWRPHPLAEGGHDRSSS
jgi:hypothetical protein